MIKLPEFIEESISRTPIPSDKDVKFEVLNCDQVAVTGDRMHLQNIIYNLLENSIKYSGNSVKIDIDYFVDGESLNITIGDNGIGINQSDLPHIFEKFYRGKEVRANGMGLGLSYVEMLVNAHRGSITVQSQVDKGTKFTIKLPLLYDKDTTCR